MIGNDDLLDLLDHGVLDHGGQIRGIDDGHVIGQLGPGLVQPIRQNESLFQMREHLLVVPYEVGVGHVGQLLAVLAGQLQRRGHLVGYQVVHEYGTGSAGVAEPHHLDGGWLQSENLVSGALGVAVHVHQDVDAVGVYPVGGLAVAGDLREVDEVLGLTGYFAPEGGAVVGAQGVAEDLDVVTVVQTRDRLHQVGGWVVAEVGADVADSEPGPGLPGVLVRRLVEHVDLDNLLISCLLNIEVIIFI